MSKVGVFTVDITPPLGIDFIGYHRPEGITAIDEQLYATAFVFENKGEKSVFISVDNAGMLIEDTNEIRHEIARELGLNMEKITVCYTHTHSGPATASEQSLVKAYKTTLISNTLHAAKKANERLEGATIGWEVTHVNIGDNRREMGSDGKVKMGTNLDGIVDRRLGVLAIRDELTREMKGLMVFCTAHPNVLKKDSNRLSADYPGLIREILSQALGCPVIIVQGAAGNVNAKYRGSMEALKHMAYKVSGHVLTMIPQIQFSPISKLQTHSTKMSMNLKEIPDPEGIKGMAKLAQEQWGVNTAKWQETILKKQSQGISKLSIDLEIQMIQINEGSFAGIPMEPFSEVAIELQEQLDNEFMFFGGYTNGYLGYLPTKEAYPYGGYEVELNPVVYGPMTGLWMPPVEDTAGNVVIEVKKMYEKDYN